jgi:hypothetical protein
MRLLFLFFTFLTLVLFHSGFGTGAGVGAGDKDKVNVTKDKENVIKDAKVGALGGNCNKSKYTYRVTQFAFYSQRKAPIP